jgi:hypothetical protein
MPDAADQAEARCRAAACRRQRKGLSLHVVSVEERPLRADFELGIVFGLFDLADPHASLGRDRQRLSRDNVDPRIGPRLATGDDECSGGNRLRRHQRRAERRLGSTAGQKQQRVNQCRQPQHRG